MRGWKLLFLLLPQMVNINQHAYSRVKEGWGAGLVPLAGAAPDTSFGFYLREAFQSQTNTEKILYNISR